MELVLSVIFSEVAVGIYVAIGGFLLNRLWKWTKHQVEDALMLWTRLVLLAEKEFESNGGVLDPDNATLKDFLIENNKKLDRVIELLCEGKTDGREE